MVVMVNGAHEGFEVVRSCSVEDVGPDRVQVNAEGALKPDRSAKGEQHKSEARRSPSGLHAPDRDGRTGLLAAREMGESLE
jgi:hypothetical protein